MSAVSVCGIVYDDLLSRRHAIETASFRWTDEHYFDRLREAACTNYLVMDVCGAVPQLELDQIYIAIEEPWYLGAVHRAVTKGASRSGWLKQQAEVAGAVKGSLLQYGYKNLHEVNNATWKSHIYRDIGIKMLDKWIIKEWAMAAFEMPDLPDLVNGPNGKIPRPHEGRGAKAKAIQPDDVYDAAGIMAWMLHEIGEPW